jgi:cell division transport system permease protein
MFYSLKEGITGLIRTSYSSMVAIFVISLSLILIGIFIIFYSNAKKLIEDIRNKIELEAFIDNSYDSNKIEQLRSEIARIKGILNIKYISPEEAAESFKQQFDKNVFDILGDNPLPASFQILLEKPYRNSEQAQTVIKQLEKISGIDEVIYRKDILLFIDKYVKIFSVIMFSIAMLLALGSIFLISNTIKLIILARLQIIETMKLVGATKSFIRRPFLIEGIIQGVLGSIFAALFFFGLLKIIKIEIPNVIIIDSVLFVIIFALGIILGFIGSVFALQRFLRF